MAQVVVRNSSNKVIRPSTGRVLRQNYQFGNSIRQQPSVNATDIRFDLGLNLTGTFTVLWWHRLVSLSAGQFPTLMLGIDVSSGAGNRRITFNGTASRYSSLLQSPTEVTLSPVSVGALNLMGFELVAGLARIRQNNGLEPSQGLVMSSIASIVRLPLTGLVGHQFRASSFWCFNRLLSAQEIDFLVNNFSGNEPASREGLICEVKMSAAEILDFSALQNGSDMRIGCRDTSGGIRHGHITGLPAGTLADQLTFANANLFGTGL